MRTYLTFFTYSKETWRAMVQKPEDRSEAARKVIEAAGGHLIAFYWMLGEHDGLAIFSAPGPEDAAAVSRPSRQRPDRQDAHHPAAHQRRGVARPAARAGGHQLLRPARRSKDGAPATTSWAETPARPRLHGAAPPQS